VKRNVRICALFGACVSPYISTVNTRYRILRYVIIAALPLILFPFHRSPVLFAQQHDAADSLGRTEEQRADVALNMFVVGSMYEFQEEYAKALTAYERALDYDNDAAIHAAAARAAMQLKRSTDAIAHLRSAVRRDPGALRLKRMLAELYLSSKQNDSAAGMLEDILRRDTSDNTSRMLLGRLYESDDTLRAMMEYRRILLHGMDRDATYRLANLYSLRGSLDSATAVLEQLREINGPTEHLLQTTANLYMRQFDFTQAAALYDSLSTSHPDKPGYRLLLAEARMNGGDWAAASDLLFPLAGNRDVGHEDRMQIGKIFFQKALQDRRDIERAVSVFDTLHADFPDDWRPLWFRGAVLFNEGETDGAIASFKEVLRIAPDNREAASILVRALVSRERYAAAIDVLSTLRENGNADAQIMIMLGELHALTGDRDAAREAWNAALRRDPGNEELQSRIKQLDNQH
jgi:predicted Zn-dependent protease